eukprot:g4239.t1
MRPTRRSKKRKASAVDDSSSASNKTNDVDNRLQKPGKQKRLRLDVNGKDSVASVLSLSKEGGTILNENIRQHNTKSIFTSSSNVLNETKSASTAILSSPKAKLSLFSPTLCKGSGNDPSDLMARLKLRKSVVVERIGEITVGKLPSKYNGPKVVPKQRHWEYVMAELQWLAKDFEREHKTQRIGARKTGKKILTWHRQQKTKLHKKWKAEEADRRKLAKKMWKNVQTFWVKIDKIVSFKQQSRVDAARAEVMDKQLDFLVTQTEELSKMLSSNLSKQNKHGRRKGNRQPVMETAKSDLLEADNISSDVWFESALATFDLTSRISGEPHFGIGDKVEAKWEGGHDPQYSGYYNGVVKSFNATTRLYSVEFVDGNIDKEVKESDIRAEYLPPEGNSVTNDSACDSDLENEIDDESTLAMEEKATKKYRQEIKNEISELKQEAQMPIEILMEKFQVERCSIREATKAMQINANGENSPCNDQTENGWSTVESNITLQDTINGPISDVESTVNDMDFTHVDEQDDESTLAAEEATGRSKKDIEEEQRGLEEEANMPIEELMKRYGGGAHNDISSSDSGTDVDNGGSDSDEGNDDMDFTHVDEQDDESTLAAEEATGRSKKDIEEEQRGLEEEANMPIEELMKRYGGGAHNDISSSDSGTDVDNGGSDSDEGNDDMDFTHVDEQDDESTLAAEEATGRSKKDIEEEQRGLEEEANMPIEELMKRYGGGAHNDISSSDNDGDSVISCASVPKVSDYSVPVPFLLSRKFQLRNYQRSGVDWLVSMHDRRLNGILADEMGLGKTIQTITLLAHLASSRAAWGPHLIIVPTSVIVNWEMEIKRWCPAFKVITYYGSVKERAMKRKGWSKANSFHICVTSYQLVVQDANTFRRKRWYYMILDEAQNIKNFQSQRWQTLLHFNTKRRLLLTGTPLQNSLMELWSLMHFLMPTIFRSRGEFKYWFSNPMTGMVEGKQAVNKTVVGRLHGIIRPFLLRRLKKDVAKELPGKFEHVIKCRLARRQQFLYEDFMSRGSTRAALSGGSVISMMGVLMQLRKVCNHPDLFEERLIASSFIMPALTITIPRLVAKCIIAKDSALTASATRALTLLHFNLSPTSFSNWNSRVAATRADELNPGVESLILEWRKRFNSSSLYKKDKIFETSFFSASHAIVSDREKNEREQRWSRNALLNKTRLARMPVYGDDLCQSVKVLLRSQELFQKFANGSSTLVLSSKQRMRTSLPYIERFTTTVPSVKPQYSSAELVVHGHLPDPWLSKPFGGCSVNPKFLSQALQEWTMRHYAWLSRQALLFPDKRLVQWDCGKFQALDPLLRRLKKQGSKVLIFTQMTKMLNVLEVFLNLHGHTYVRLDGSTKVEERQRLMDRFNADKKLFAFILSTRSGGMGINLTGADTVIFYDSDWNPAMDAQAQDRAHRIGQTRDVHIYRMVTEHTVEENILMKANQKRHLQQLSVEDGSFNTKFFDVPGEEVSVTDLLKGTNASMINSGGKASKKEIEEAMAAAEDDEDRAARRRAKTEERADAAEFSENGLKSACSSAAPSRSASPLPGDANVSDETSKNGGVQSSEMSKEDEAKWRGKSVVDLSLLEAQLPPIQRLALRNVEAGLDPEAFAKAAAEKLKEEVQGMIEHRDAVRDELTREEERLPLELSYGKRQGYRGARRMYRRKRRRTLRQRKYDLLTGKTWTMYICDKTFRPFYYCKETGRNQWEKPDVLVIRDSMANAHILMYQGLPKRLLTRIFLYLTPLPDRPNVARVCPEWHAATRSHSLSLVVSNEAKLAAAAAAAAVGRGSLIRQNAAAHAAKEAKLGAEKLAKEYEGVFETFEEALSAALPGQTIYVKSGTYREPTLLVDRKVRLIGEGSVVVIMRGSLRWKASGGEIKGIEIRSVDKKIPHAITVKGEDSRLKIVQCDITNRGGTGAAVDIRDDAFLTVVDSVVHSSPGAGIFQGSGRLVLARNNISHNRFDGLVVVDGITVASENTLKENGHFGISIFSNASASFDDNLFLGNAYGSWDIAPRSNLPLHCGNTSYGKATTKKNKKVMRQALVRMEIRDENDATAIAKKPVTSSGKTVLIFSPLDN